MSDGVQNPLDLSDEDFLKLAVPTDTASEPTTEEAPGNTGAEGVSGEEGQQPGGEGGEAGTEGQGGEGTGAEAQGAEGQGEGGGNAAGTEGAEGGAAQPKAEEQQGKEGVDGKKAEGTVPASGSEAEGGEGKDKAKSGEGEGASRTAEDHAKFYEAVMKPFVANGKTIKLNSPEEVIQLMQQGANYTRKMQAIAPHRKMLTMAQNNGIDEDKLSFLIDLDKGSPEAIQKFLKDKGVDPLSIDLESEPTYREGTHKVTDNDVAFQTNLEELSSTPEGKETLQTLNTWDDASKEVLWGDPKLMPLIHQQRANGIYDRITGEMERRRVLGQITPETSFIEAYRLVGDDLMKSGGFADLAPKQTPTITTPAPKAEPVATTAAAPKPTVENGDKASAASPTRSTPKTAKTVVNPLALSDAEFEAQFAQFQGRV